MTYWIDGDLWLSWTDEQRGEYLTYMEGKKWGISFSKNPARDLQKDHDEYIEEMSIGGQTYKKP